MTPHETQEPDALRRRIVALLVVTALGVPQLVTAQTPAAPAVPAAADTAPIAGSARLAGRILRSDGKTPEPGAIVRVCSLDDPSAVASATADAKGEFALEGLTHGFVEIVVSAGDGLFAANQVVQLAPAERKVFDFVLVPAPDTPASATGNDARPSACADRPPTGSARMQPKTTGGEFIRSKKGIAIVAGTGAAVLLLLSAGGGDDEVVASPSGL